MDCNKIKEQLLEYSLNGLDISKSDLNEHLECCPSCIEYASESKELWSLLDTLDEMEPESAYLSNFWSKVDEEKLKSSSGVVNWIKNLKPNWTLAGAMASIFLVSIITFGAFSPDTRNSLFMSTDERDELILIELDNALAKETADILSIYGPWDGGTDVDINGGFN
ncbi:MAG: hypothetical protein AAF462_00565 [Thermodesulfobacteriota bacterium]